MPTLPGNFRFESPWAFWLLLAIAVVLLVVLARSRGASAAVLFPSLALLPRGGTPWRFRLAWISVPLRLAALVLLVAALARPQVGEPNFEVTTEAIDMVLVLDTSFSMRDMDFGGGSRIDGAKRVMREFLGGLENDRVGLALFSGEAVVLSPLSRDYRALQRLVDPVEAGVLAGGTAIGTGLATGINLLRDSDAPSRVVILLTDGENNAGDIGPLDAANLARTLGIRVHTIGATGFMAGRMFSRLEIDEQQLRRMAEVTGGLYFRASDPRALAAIYQDIEELERRPVSAREFTTYQDVALWLLLPGLALLAVELLLGASLFRRIP